MFFEELHGMVGRMQKKSHRVRLNQFKQKAPNQRSRLFILRRCTVIDSSACTVLSILRLLLPFVSITMLRQIPWGFGGEATKR